MGLLFENPSDDDFVLPSGLGKGKGKGQAVVGVGSPQSPAAAAGSRIRKKSWRKALADDAEVGWYSDGNNNKGDNENSLRAHPISAPAFLDAQRPKKRPPRLPSLSSLAVSTHTFDLPADWIDKTKAHDVHEQWGRSWDSGLGVGSVASTQTDGRWVVTPAASEEASLDLRRDVCKHARLPQRLHGC